MISLVFTIFSACSNDDSDPPTSNITCDNSIAINDSNPLNAVKALDICQTASAKYIRANGMNTSHSAQIAITDSFGKNVSPQNGQRMLVLSTGVARSTTQSGACGDTSCFGNGPGNPPNGYPQDITGCSPNNNINDDIGFEITLIAPENAQGFSFDFIFFTFDYPELICNPFNDQFIVTINTNPAGSINGNIAFDSNSTPIGVNANFINPGMSNLLQSTGFDSWGDAATTGWTRTSAPVVPNQEFTLSFIIWDTGDQSSDSTVVLDNFQWKTSNTVVSSNSI